MDLLYNFVLTIHIIICIVLIFIVLLQAGRGAELGAAFGSIGQANSVRTSGTFLGKFTTSLAVIFMVTSLSLAYMSSNKSSSSVTTSVNPNAIEQTVPTEEKQSEPVTPVSEENTATTSESQ